MNDIKIIGGGTAGWMAAATLISQFPDKKITLIESPNIATVGVGESTIGQINHWLALLDIKDSDWMKHCDATYKLSIRFNNFYRKDSDSFHYPFGQPYVRENTDGANDWYFKKFLYPDTPTSNYSECLFPQMSMVNNNTISSNEDGKLPGFDFRQDVAYQFDATKFGLWLKENYCLPRGVQHILAEVKDVEVNNEGVEFVTLDDGRKIAADLFIDCTGFKALLIGEALKEPFETFEKLLPNNSAWATKIPYENKEEQLVNYTNCTAVENGWIWEIPLWTRFGCGYVYSDKYVSDDDALLELQGYLKQKNINTDELDFKKIPMRTGVHKRLWVKNVCAIGLSAGFIEPLESNGLFTVHEFLRGLVRVLQRGSISQWDRDTFSISSRSLLQDFCEFVALHFAFSHRDDTEYWRDVMNREYVNHYTDDLVHLSHTAIHDKMRNCHYNLTQGLHCIATGMGVFPLDFSTAQAIDIRADRMFYQQRWADAISKMDKRKANWDAIAKEAQTHMQFLQDQR